VVVVLLQGKAVDVSSSREELLVWWLPGSTAMEMVLVSTVSLLLVLSREVVREAPERSLFASSCNFSL
jgi:hypothetical protein